MTDKIIQEIPDFLESEEELLELVHIKVDPGQSALRIDQFLSNRLAKVSRSRIQAAIQAGMVKVNDQLIKSSYKLSGGEFIELKIPTSPDTSGVLPENIPLEIVYEDADVMVINKTAGMVVHPAAGLNSGTLVNALAHYFQSSPTPVAPISKTRYGLVHRIDKETSGLLVIAKNDFAHVHLAKQFFDHSIEREYLALVWGEPDPPEGRIEVNIGRDPRFRQRQFAFKDGLEGKPAVTHFQLVESFYYTSLVRCNLETGRTHQIRVHMKYIGHTLFNDEKYGGDKILKGTVFNKYKQFIDNCFSLMPRFGLHARSLGFVHPVTNKKLYFEVELPDDFKQLIVKWRNYTESRREILE